MKRDSLVKLLGFTFGVAFAGGIVGSAFTYAGAREFLQPISAVAIEDGRLVIKPLVGGNYILYCNKLTSKGCLKYISKKKDSLEVDSLPPEENEDRPLQSYAGVF